MNNAYGPSPEGLRRARLDWEQSALDLRDARRRLAAGDGLQCSFFSLQAALNALAAVSRLCGHFQLPGHSPTQMLALCRAADPRFALLEGPCAALESVSGQDPFRRPERADGGLADGQRALDDATTVHRAVRAFLQEHRATYFAP